MDRGTLHNGQSVSQLTLPRLNDWLSEARTATRWIVEHIVPCDSLVLVSGQQKRAHKTWLADSLAIAISTGVPIGGFNVLEPGPVLYCQEEGSFAGTRNRILGICQTYKVSQADLNNIHFSFHRRVKLDAPKWRKALVDYVSEHNIKCIVLDAITYMHLADENKISEMAPVIETLQDMRSLGASVIYLAHLDKTRGESKRADIDSQVRGASIVVNAYDQHIALRRYAMKEQWIKLTVRAREAEERDYRLRWDIKLGDADPETKLRPVKHAELIFEELNEAGQLHATADLCHAKLLSGQQYTMATLKRAWGTGAERTKKILEVLLESGLVRNEGTNYIKVENDGK